MNDQQFDLKVDDRPTRVPGLEMHPLNDQYVVYDENTDHVHYLNASAALILESCGDMKSVAEIVSLVQDVFALERAPQDEVVRCLRGLMEKQLIALPRAGKSETSSQSRLE
jgi:hypothetical protein